MKTFTIHLWSRLRVSYWFVPGMAVALAALLAWGCVALDHALGDTLPEAFPRLGRISAGGMRSLLSTAATAVLTLAGLTFSATLVALTLASSQFGSRLLRNFIRSMPNQVAVGVLLATFVLCLIVLRNVLGSGSAADPQVFVPHVAGLVAFGATLLSLGTFIYFVHHIATSLQADHIVAAVHRELDRALERHFPDARPDERDEQEAREDKREWEEIDDETVLVASRSGYLQAVDTDGLLESAIRRDLRCRLLYRPGQFVVQGQELLTLTRLPDGCDRDAVQEDLLEHLIVGGIRTAEHDFEFCLRQLVEIALRALSPGINDPFTAIICIDYLGAALAKVAGRRLPARTFHDERGVARVRVRPTMFADLVAAAFAQLPQAAGDRPDIAIRLLEAFAAIACATRTEAHWEAIRTEADAVAARALADLDHDGDRAAVEEARAAVSAAWSGAGGRSVSGA